MRIVRGQDAGFGPAIPAGWSGGRALVLAACRQLRCGRYRSLGAANAGLIHFKLSLWP